MDYIGFGYAAAVAAGGIVGYVKAGSFISLVMGLIFGSLSAVGSYQTSRNPKDFYLLLMTSATLMSIMGYRSINAGKFMPSGLVATLSLMIVVRLAPRLLG
ncbi:Transmembrane protein 14C [Lamellibrachia satsuma]|nr:Transmembrane protein 14C [Lamellibrachia satsuma]